MRNAAGEIRSKADLPTWRQDTTTGHRFSLVLTKAARAFRAAEGGTALPDQVAAAAGSADGAAPAQPAGSEPAGPRVGSKLLGVLALIAQEGGTTVSDIMAVTGWLPHTTRAALTGLRKRGYPVLRQPGAEGAGSTYHIGPTEAVAATAA